uniref:Uncharacterized protein n=1 Tax=Calidris pygmaea TaxID=425635 RepID=A0A8C3J7P9_9CHAR
MEQRHLPCINTLLVVRKMPQVLQKELLSLLQNHIVKPLRFIHYFSVMCEDEQWLPKRYTQW